MKQNGFFEDMKNIFIFLCVLSLTGCGGGCLRIRQRLSMVSALANLFYGL